MTDGSGSPAEDGDPLCRRYHIKRHDFLGQGADGWVLRGVHRGSGQWHALKYLSRKAYDVEGEVKALQSVLRSLMNNDIQNDDKWIPNGNDITNTRTKIE